MTITTVMIPNIEDKYTAEYIANVLWNNNIAKVSKITITPAYLKEGNVYNNAYILIQQWCESEAAYNIIQRLKNPEKEARIVHYDDEWWTIELNTHNNGDINVLHYTTKFNDTYFLKNEELDEDDNCVLEAEFPDEEMEGRIPIGSCKWIYQKFVSNFA